MKQRILAVDDEPHMLILLQRIIQGKTPYDIVTTNNALEVPKLLESQEYDLVITDLKMPGMDGLDILRVVKEKKLFAQVIMITAFGSLETAIEALSQGVFDYITKPFKKEQIIFTVDRAMRWQQVKREVVSLRGLFDEEPYQAAEAVFRQEYLKRLAVRCDHDASQVSERAGLPADQVAQALRENGGNQEQA